eukprot:TRINITY_DN1168_c0_g1_i3.p1 TRINITY_DN1168_c0_g1~~TRINITY_DN1168_c0_g1_i3.p1  ORF type:complete len:704 (+),score=218.99 TRINITY_DN1168_c0_g1_i3:82-2112(+)
MTANEQYLAPKEQPVFQLDCKTAFEKLTDKEKKYSYYLSKACWNGCYITLDQVSTESPSIFNLLFKLFSGDKVDELKQNAEKKGVKAEDFEAFVIYSAAFIGNMGNYLSFGATKFVPRVSADTIRTILEASSLNGEEKNSILNTFDSVKDKMFSLNPNELTLSLPENGGVTRYYSENITSQDIAFVREYMKEKDISAYNTRIWKNENGLELRIASVEKREEIVEFKGQKIKISYGDHSEFLAKVAKNIRNAIPYAANEHQSKMLEKYAQHFEKGDVNDHKAAQSHWIKDIGPAVETNIGFVESYVDPEGERGEFEGFVSCVNKETSAKYAKLVEAAPQFISLLPWPKSFEKDQFLRPDFTALEVISWGGAGLPAGINLPNYDDIRQENGFKNVSLQNVLSAKSLEKADYIKDDTQDLYQKYESDGFGVQVAIHELLGHGTGKLFNEENFPRNLVNPLTNQPVSSWYQKGETWDSKFQSLASTIEECRAEAVGIYLSTVDEILKLFGHEGQIAEDVFYVNWLVMVRAGLRALEFYTPEGKKWGQAHMQARYCILKVLLNAGEGLVTIEEQPDNLFVVLDRTKIKTVGKKAIGDFLTKLQVYKSTANVEECSKMYLELSEVDEKFLKWRKIVLDKKKPRRAFVQSFLELKNDQVQLHEFEASPRGLIQSFVSQFKNLE